MLKRKLRRLSIKKPVFKSLYIAVQPVGSKFAKGLQSALRNKVINNVFRVTHNKGDLHEQKGRSLFRITEEPLDKIQQFKRFHQNGVSAPGFTTDPAKLGELGSRTVFCRTLVNSTNGRGIVEYDTKSGGPVPSAPLYTAYIPKKAEYRVHVFGDKVVDIQQKRKKREFNQDDRDTRIRNMANGYVYCRDGIVPPVGINELAVKAVKALGYRYGAVDIIYNEKNNALYVLEVNSRPGLMGTTLDKYADALINAFNLRLKNV